MKNQKMNISRRKFLSGCSALSLGSCSALATLSSLQLAHAQTAPGEDYKALVCIFLFGGNDAFNMLVPREQSEYNTYANTRQNLAIARDDLLPISASSQAYSEFGLNPDLGNIQSLYNDGKVAFLANVGSLIEPVTKTSYQQKSVALPPQLFSHNDQQAYMQSLQSSGTRNGWAGRAAEVLSQHNTHERLSMNISLNGSNLWQNGSGIIPYSVNPAGVESLDHLNRTSTDDRDIARIQAYQSILAQNQQHMFARSFAGAQSIAWDLADEVSLALASTPNLSTAFPSNNRLASSLQMVAKLISARNSFGASRQTFFIGMGDFDTHGDQLNRHPALMQELNGALQAFYNATAELGLADKITTFTASDFGRTLTSNGDGTDHAWGSHQMIMGDAVKGGDIYGSIPSMAINSNDDIGEGRIIPTSSMDQYGATLASWFGLPPSNFADVFPNLSNFDSADLGFINAG